MQPQLALLLGTALVCWLLYRDMRWRRLPSPALWIAGLWLLFASSRQVSFWLNFGRSGESSSLEGSPINLVFNSALILAAILVLRQRGFSWGKFSSANKALVAIFAFFLCSMLWSPFPVPTLKRVIQNFGCVLSGLIILTEKDPAASLRVVFARVSYVLFPLSVVFIRYFPHIGRVVSLVSGTHMLSGVTGHKNALGEMTMVFCLVLLWDLMETRKHETAPKAKPKHWTRLISLGIGLYLLVISDSATGLLCFLLGVVLLYIGKRLARMKNARQVIMVGALAMACLLAFEQVFGMSGGVFKALDSDTTLTGRTDIWRVTLEKNTAHLLGNGLGAFWETSEGESVWREIGMNRLVTAHNGYLETYLNGGLVGLFLLGAMIWSTGLNAMNKLVKRDPIGRLALLFWFIILINNVTESVFFFPGPLWLTMLLVTIDSQWQNGPVEGGHP
jgi:O-antigen ligase